MVLEAICRHCPPQPHRTVTALLTPTPPPCSPTAGTLARAAVLIKRDGEDLGRKELAIQLLLEEHVPVELATRAVQVTPFER